MTGGALTAAERDYIRHELNMFFSTLPTVAEGFRLKTWRSGVEVGRRRWRGLMRLDTMDRLPRLFFTETGLTVLRTMMAARRYADPVKFAHVRQELGIDTAQVA